MKINIMQALYDAWKMDSDRVIRSLAANPRLSVFQVSAATAQTDAVIGSLVSKKYFVETGKSPVGKKIIIPVLDSGITLYDSETYEYDLFKDCVHLILSSEALIQQFLIDVSVFTGKPVIRTCDKISVTDTEIHVPAVIDDNDIQDLLLRIIMSDPSEDAALAQKIYMTFLRKFCITDLNYLDNCSPHELLEAVDRAFKIYSDLVFLVSRALSLDEIVILNRNLAGAQNISSISLIQMFNDMGMPHSAGKISHCDDLQVNVILRALRACELKFTPAIIINQEEPARDTNDDTEE